MSLILDGSNGTTGNLANGDLQVNGVTVGKGGGTVATNTAVGTSALNANTTGNNNTAIGYQAGYSNSTGTYNTLIGRQAGYSTTGSDCTFVGNGAGYYTTGNNNTLIGDSAGFQITTGAKNTVLGTFPGNQGGLDIRTASNYIVLSDGDGNPRIITDTNGQTSIGGNPISSVRFYVKGSGTTSSTYSLYADDSAATNIFYVRNDGAGYLKAASWTYGSDISLKENIVYLTPQDCLTKLLQAKPATFDYINGEKNNYGYVANDVEKWLPEAVTMLDSGTRGLKDGFINVISSGSIQALYQIIQELKAEVDSLKQQLVK